MNVKIKNAVIKKQTDKWTIYAVELEDGTKADTFDKVDIGQEYDVVITDGQYGKNMKVNKERKDTFKFTRNPDLEKKKHALDCAIRTHYQSVECNPDNVIVTANKYLNWLNQ